MLLHTSSFRPVVTTAAWALALALGALPGHAAGPTVSPANPAAWSAQDGEVIVGFKSQASLLRKHALGARAPAATVQNALAQRATSLGQRLGRTLESGAALGDGVQVMRSPGVDATTLARQLAADPDVAYAVPNGRKYKVAAPNDPLYAATAAGGRVGGPDSGQWYLRAPDSTIKSAIHIEAAWARTTGTATVVVAVLDTGVRFEHPDLGRVESGGKLLPGYDMVSNALVANDGDGRDADPSDPGDWVTATDKATSTFSDCDVSGSSWHGTSTSALVAAATNTNPATGMAGAAPGVRVLPVRVLGKCFGNDSDIIAGMRWAAGISVAGIPDNPNPAKVINMSLGGSGSCSAAYQAAVDEITARGVTIVAAAGNSAGGPVSTPANCRGVVGVLALRHAGSKVGFSDLGPEIAIAAPGGNCINITPGSACLYPILSATNTGSQGPVSSSWTNGSFDITVGTSFSSPLVAGVVALMVSQQPLLSVAQIRSALQSSARPFPTTGADNGPSDATPVEQCRAPVSGVDQYQCYCNTSFCGAGMLDAGQAVAAVSGAFARIDVTTTTPTAGTSVALSATGSLASPGATVTQYTWSLSNSSGVVPGFSSATNASTATLLPTAGGQITVQLTVTDSSGQSNTASLLVNVAAAPTPAPITPAATGGGGGGGASSGAWVGGVGLAAALLQLLRIRAARSPGALKSTQQMKPIRPIRASRRRP